MMKLKGLPRSVYGMFREYFIIIYIREVVDKHAANLTSMKEKSYSDCYNNG
ncbi:MAG TPA: hypothetical protein VIK71_10750 [Flavobacteriales bacterium]